MRVPVPDHAYAIFDQVNGRVTAFECRRILTGMTGVCRPNLCWLPGVSAGPEFTLITSKQNKCSDMTGSQSV
jgi:hypothetical protein